MPNLIKWSVPVDILCMPLSFEMWITQSNYKHMRGCLLLNMNGDNVTYTEKGDMKIFVLL